MRTDVWPSHAGYGVHNLVRSRLGLTMVQVGMFRVGVALCWMLLPAVSADHDPSAADRADASTADGTELPGMPLQSQFIVYSRVFLHRP